MKHLLRQKLLHRRKHKHPAGPANNKSVRIAQRVLKLPVFVRAKTILLYAPVHREVDTRRIFSAAVHGGKCVAFPKVKGKTLQARQVKNWKELKKGAFGVLEPNGRAKRVQAKELDLVLVPGVAFDRQGHRLGYGKGFYDRFLKQLNPKTATVGLAYAFQVVNKIPRQPHDVKVQRVVTEKRER